MTELVLRKLRYAFVPADQVSSDIMEDMGMNAEFKAVLTKPRNIKYHRKFFALVNYAFDNWEMPVSQYKGIPIKKNRERFRNDLTIMAGFGYPVVNIKGEVRYKAKSISFAKMDETEFEKLYSRFVDVILHKVLTNYKKHDLEHVVQQVLGFT